MLTDLSCLALLGLWAYLGWRRGLVLSTLSLISVGASYLCAYLLYRPVGELLGGALDLQPLLAYPLGGLTVFFVAALAFSVLRWAAGRWREVALARRSRWVLPGRIAGAAVSMVYAAGILLVLLWALIWLHASFPGAPDVRSSVAGRVAAPLAAGLAQRLVGRSETYPGFAGVADRLARDPQRTVESLGAVLGDPRMRAVAGKAGSPARAGAEGKALRQLGADPDFVRRAQEAGLLQAAEAGPISPEEAATQLGATLAPLQRAIDALARDREVRKLLEDPELQKRLQRKDLAALANDPKFNLLAQRVLQQLRATGPITRPAVPGGAPEATPPSKPKRAAPEEHLYRWRDRRGRVHYGNHPPSDLPYEEIEPPL